MVAPTTRPYISAPMTRRFTRLAWTAATFTYLLIILGAIVRITGSGLGCGEHWPLCNGKLLPPLDLPTLIEYGHRLAAAAVSVLVAAVAAYAWWLRREGPTDLHQPPPSSTALHRPGVAAYVALMLLLLQVGLGAVTVKLSLPPWTVILHLGTAMLLLATLILIARGRPRTPPSRAGLYALAVGFVTVLFGALTANLGAASACLGFPLCNDQFIPWVGGVHLGALRVDVHVDLAAHAEALREIDPRLDREAHARHEGARVLGLEVVDVRSGAVQVAIDRMARAMHEVVGEPGVADHGARGVVHLRPRHRAVRPPALPQEADGGVSGALHRLPYPADLCVGRAARESDPRLIGEHRALPWPGPQIEQDHVARREATTGSGMGLVVGHRAGRPERHDGPLVGPEARTP